MTINSSIAIASKIYKTFLTITKNNIFYILLITLLPRLQTYLVYTDKIGNWSTNFLEGNTSVDSQALQMLLVLLQYILIAAIYYNSTKADSTLVSSLKACLRKTHKIIIVTILYLIAVLIGIALLVLPGIYVMVLYSLAFISVITTNLSIIGAFKNSKKLISGNWVFSFFIIIIVMSIPSLLFGFIGYHSSSYTTSVIFNEIFIIFANMVSIVAMITGTLFLYQELESRQQD